MPFSTISACDATGQGRGDRRERHRRNAELLQPAAGALALPEDQQPAGAADAGDPATTQGGGRVPRWPVGADAGGGPATACRGNQVGYQTLPADEPPGRSSSNRLTVLLWAPMGPEQNNPNPTTFQHPDQDRKCERLWKLPIFARWGKRTGLRSRGRASGDLGPSYGVSRKAIPLLNCLRVAGRLGLPPLSVVGL